MIRSYPPKEAVIINKVDNGIWKFVIMLDATLKSYGGNMNLLVHDHLLRIHLMLGQIFHIDFAEIAQP